MSGLRVGLIGVGRIGVLHARTLQANAGLGELILADADTARAAREAAAIGATAMSVDDLFAVGLDAVVVSAAHADLVRRAAAARRTPAFSSGSPPAYAAEIDAFIAVVQGRGENPSSEAADRSRLDQRPVDVAEVR